MGIDLSTLPGYRPYTNIQPFTVRDGATYLLVLEGLREWLRDTLVPHVDKEISELVSSWQGNTAELTATFQALASNMLAQVNAAVEGVNEDAQAAIAAQLAAEAARDLAEQYSGNAVEFQDAAMTTIFNNAASLFRTAIISTVGSELLVEDPEDPGTFIINQGA